MPAPLSEGTFRVAELAALPVAISRALAVENEITFLSVPVPADGVVLWGKGHEVDRQTLLEHRDRWVRDPAPGHARLARLTSAEASLHEDLVTDRLGESVRMKQERIAWQWAQERLSD